MPRFPVALSALTLGAALSLPLPALAQLGGVITGLDVDRVAELARAYGPAERQHHDVEVGPWIDAEVDGIFYTISFLNCENGANCTSLQFRAWWESGGAHSIEEMNRWNRERRFSKAYLDINGNATLEFDVNLAGGVTAVNFDDTLQWWQVVTAEFVEDVIDPGYQRAAGSGSGARPAPTK